MVSVIIPIHNRFEIVDQTIDSVFKQTFRPLEIIIVDDKSSTQFVYDKYINKDQKVHFKYLKLIKNMGPGYSREQGRQISSGKYICYLDSDDLLHPQKIEKQVIALAKHPQAGMCYCRSVIFSQLPINGSELIRKRSNQEFSSFLPTILDGRPWGTAACLWTKEATERIGPWINAWTWEDHDYDCRAGCIDIPIVYIPETLTYYRLSENRNQLSSTEVTLAVKNRVPALLAMSQNLRESKKIYEIEIGKKFSKILVTNAGILFSCGRVNLASVILNEILHNSRKFSKIWCITTFILFFREILPFERFNNKWIKFYKLLN